MAHPDKKLLDDWMLTGGEALVGGGIKQVAAREEKRLLDKLETPNLFPHIEHEDRHKLERVRRDAALGQQMVDRYRSRKHVLGALLKPADDSDLPAVDLDSTASKA